MDEVHTLPGGQFEPVDACEIDGLRKDAVAVMKGHFLIAIAPFGLLLLAMSRAMANFPSVEAGAIVNPTIAALSGVTVAAFAFGRTASRLTSRSLVALIVVLGGACLAAALLPAIAIYLVATGRIGGPSTDMATLLMLAGLLSAATVIPVAIFAVPPMRAAMRLRKARLPPAGTPLATVMDAVRIDAAAGSRAPLPPAGALMRALLLFTLAIAVGLIATVLILWLFGQQKLPLMGLGLLVEFAALYIAIRLWRRGRREIASDAASLLERDNRAPVLYLRPFGDDTDLLEAEWGIVGRERVTAADRRDAAAPRRFTLASLLPVGALNTSGRLEEAIGPEVRPLGPFIGIGAPDEPLPQLGAARAYYTNETWQTAIVRWIGMARLIVKVAGPTAAIRWELENIISHGAMSKLVMLFPPGTHADRTERWHNIASCLDGTLWQAAAASIEPDRLVGLRFLQDGRLSAVYGGQERTLDYVLALRILLHGLLTGK